MSKASEFSKEFAKSPKPPAFNVGSVMDPIAVVDKAGGLALNGHCSAEQALVLARWILDTFGEAP